MQISDQGSKQKTFTFLPKWIAAAAFSLRVGHQGRDQFQNVLLAVDIGKGVVVHGLVEIDGVHRLNEVPLLCKGMSALVNETSFRVRNHE